MPPAIVIELSGVYSELAEKRSWSDILRVDLSEAEAKGRIERLLLRQCDPKTEPLFFYRGNCWIADGSGIIQRDYGPEEADTRGVVPEDFPVRNPDIRFFIQGSTIRLYMCFGRRWLWRKEAILDSSGRLLRDTLQD